MDRHDELTRRFESHRGQLRAAAYRILGSGAEADDIVQEAWLRLVRTDVSGVENLEAWLRTVVSRLCLDALRTRGARREEPLEQHAPPPIGDDGPEHQAVLIDSVGRAMLVVLDRLTPAERVAFVLHDLFAVPFDEIAPIVDRTPVAAKKLASRARARVRGTTDVPDPARTAERKVVEAFLAAARDGDLDALLTVLAPDVVRRTTEPGRESVIEGADAVCRETMVLGRGARFAETALVDGSVGILVAPGGQLSMVLVVTVRGDRVAEYTVITDPDRLRELDLVVL